MDDVVSDGVENAVNAVFLAKEELTHLFVEDVAFVGDCALLGEIGEGLDGDDELSIPRVCDSGRGFLLKPIAGDVRLTYRPWG